MGRPARVAGRLPSRRREHPRGAAPAARPDPDAARTDHGPDLPRGVRIRLWLLLAYLLSPIDLAPDGIPVLGYADDAIIVALAPRSVARRAGAQALERHWPGTPHGLTAVRALAGIRGS